MSRAGKSATGYSSGAGRGEKSYRGDYSYNRESESDKSGPADMSRGFDEPGSRAAGYMGGGTSKFSKDSRSSKGLNLSASKRRPSYK
jgi:hypothetical protein